MRIRRALEGFAITGVAGAGAAAIAIALCKVTRVDERTTWVALVVAGALPLIGALIGALRPVRTLFLAQLADRALGLRGRLSNAVAFSAVPAAERSPLMNEAIADGAAAATASPLDARRVVAIRISWDLPLAFALAAGAVLLSMVEVPREVRRPVHHTRHFTALEMHRDDLDAFREELRDLNDDPSRSEEVRRAAQQFNQLIEDLADRRLDRDEAFRRLRELDEAMRANTDEGSEAMRQALEQLGTELQRSEMTRAAGEAMRQQQLAQAEQALRQLAEQVRRGEGSRRDIERARDALRRAAQQRPPDRQQELTRRREEIQRLLQRQQQQQPSERDQRLLRQRQRELERLERQQQQEEQQRRELERLQRDMEQAAQQMDRQDREQAAQQLERGAEDMNRMARQQASEEQMRQMRERLSELRELMRQQQQQQRQAQQQQGGQQGQSGQQQQQQAGTGSSQGERLERFAGRARGQNDNPGPGQQGQAPGGRQGQGDQPGVQQGSRLGQAPGGQGDQQRGTGDGQHGERQDGARQGGTEAGVGTDHHMLDDPSRLGGDRQDLHVRGEQRQGPSRSQVILGAADRGFTSRDYRRVYGEYRAHADEVLEHDEIPGGFRFYVRRYFQLIRPRDTD